MRSGRVSQVWDRNFIEHYWILTHFSASFPSTSTCLFLTLPCIMSVICSSRSQERTLIPAAPTTWLRSRFGVTMRSSTTSAVLLCLLAGAMAAVQTPQTGERVGMDPDESAELHGGLVWTPEREVKGGQDDSMLSVTCQGLCSALSGRYVLKRFGFIKYGL